MAENDIGDLIIRIRATADNLEQVAEEAKARLQGIGKAAEQTKKPMKEAGEAGKDAGEDMASGAREGELAWLALAAAAVLALGKIDTKIDDGIENVNAYKDALNGLNSAAEYVGVSQGEIAEATATVTNEFFNTEAAATSLKNLLLRGFSLGQAVSTIQNLQDAAAYGRQASLTLSEAVKSATEGLKNENSILVDNAGVTKNVAKMWEEYAKARGISTTKMTQAQKVEAEYLGIQQETAAMTGDLASLQDTLSGKMARTENQTYLLSKAFGSALTPMKEAETNLKNGILAVLTELAETYPAVTAGATTATGALLGMLAIAKVITLLKTFQAQLLAINASLGPIGIAALAIGALATAYTAYKNHLEKVREEEEKRIQQNKEAAEQQQERIDLLDDMIARYVELKRKQSITYTEAVELKAIENDLAEQYGITKEQVDDLARSTDTYTQSIRDLTAAEREKLDAAQEISLDDARKAAESAVQAPMEQLDMVRTERAVDYQQYKQYGTGSARFIKDVKLLENQVAEAFSEYGNYIDTALATAEQKAINAGQAWNETVSSALSEALMLNINPAEFDGAAALTAYVDEQLAMIADAAGSAEMQGAIDSLQGIMDQVNAGATDIDFSGMDQAIGQIDALWETLRANLNMTKEEFVAAVSPIDYLAIGLDNLEASLIAEAEAQNSARSITAGAAEATKDLSAAQSEAAASYATLKSNIDAYNAALNEGEKDRAAVQVWRDLNAQIETLDKSSKEYETTMSGLMAAANELDLRFDGSDASRERVNADVEQKAEDLLSNAEVLEETRKELMASIHDVLDLGTDVLSTDDIATLKSLYLALANSEVRAEGLQFALQGASEEYAELAEKADAYYAALQKQENKALAIQDWNAQKEQLDALAEGTDEYEAKLAEMITTARELGIVFDGTPEDLKRTARAIDLQAAGIAEAAEELEKARQEIQKTIAQYLEDESVSDEEMIQLSLMLNFVDESEARTDGLDAIGDYFDAYKERFSAELEDAQTEIEDGMGTWNEELADGLSLALRYALSNLGIEDTELSDQIAGVLINAIAAAANDETMAAALDTINEFNENLMNGIVPSEEDTETFIEAWETMLGEDSPLLLGLEAMVEAGEITAEQMEEFKEVIESLYDPLSLLGDTMEETAGRVADAAAEYSEIDDVLSDAEKTVDDAKKSIETFENTIKKADNTAKYAKQWKDIYSQWKTAKKEGKDVSKILDGMEPLFKVLGREMDGSEQSIEDVNAAFDRLAADAQADLPVVLNELYALEAELFTIASNDEIDVEARADASQALAALAELIAYLLTVIDLYAQIGGVSTGGGGGGGGRSSGGAPSGGGVTETAYEKEIDHLEHLKALDQLTYEQELEHLEDISRRRIATAEEALDLEERIYDVKKEIAERDAENLTDLTEAIVDALEERYDKMREAEIGALDQSREAWEEWREHNVSAIEEQIAALDALEEAEDRQADQEEHLRKIAMLEQSLAYEQDEYNRMQLQKQLEDAQGDYDDFLSDIEREDQIAALEAQIKAIEDTADAEIAALDEQQKAIEAYYDERMTAANLQAEAEIELMNSTQQEIIDLLAAYAPDYDAAGRSLGEKFMDGFTSIVGTFNDWWLSFEDQVTNAVDRMQAANVAAARSRAQTYDADGNPLGGIVLNNENNFYVPVETPAETAARIQQANEDLAEQIAGE